MTRDELILFISRFDGFATWPTTKQADYLTYYLLAQCGIEAITASDIAECFDLLDLRPYSRLGAYLSEEVKKKGGKYVKRSTGYRLAREEYDNIRVVVDSEPHKVHMSKQLADLVPKMKESQEKSFLEEAIRCYRVEAYRATVVLIWILTMEHMQRHVFANHLSDFNSAITALGNKRINPVVNYHDFSNLKESQVIELMKSAGVISGDVRKILDEKLGVRNTAGHPSGVNISGHKASEVIIDLIENVLLEY